MNHKKHVERSRERKVQAYADGGAVEGYGSGKWAAEMRNATAEDKRRMDADVPSRRVSPTAQQVFTDGSKGPMNINPHSIPMSRKSGGRV